MPESHALSKPAYSVAVGDVTGDGAPDVLAGESTPIVEVFQNDGAGSFAMKGNFVTSGGVYGLVLFDMDGDADLDAVTAEVNTDQLGVYANSGSGSFSLGNAYATGGDSRAVAAGEFNHGR